MFRARFLKYLGAAIFFVIVMFEIATTKDFYLFVYPFIILFILSIPLINRNKADYFSIWSWIFYSSILGVFLRILYIFFSYPNYKEINNVFLIGNSKSFLVPAMLVVFTGVVFLVFGFSITRKKIALKKKVFISDVWKKKKFFIISYLLIITSLLSFVYFIELEGGLSSILLNVSGYRGVSETLKGASSRSYLRLLISLSGTNLFLLTAWLVRYKERKIMAIFLWIISFIIFIFYNFYVSQRSAIVFTMVQLIALVYYAKGFKLPRGKMIIGLTIGLVLFQVMTLLRHSENLENKNIDFSLTKAINQVVLTTNMIDVSKTAHIIKAIPHKINYEYGLTLTTIFIAWIPRELWREKPSTNVDNTIGRRVFGATTYGSGAVPPGIFAEMYWNFWVPGVIIGCFFIGVLLKIINESIISNIQNFNVILLHVVVFMYLGLSFIGSSFTSVLVSTLMTFIPLYLILNFITVKNRY